MKNVNSTIASANKNINLATELVKSLNVAKNNKMIKDNVLTVIEQLKAELAEISEKAETKVNTKFEERQRLTSLCKTLKEQVVAAGFKMPVNQMLQAYYIDKGANRLATQDSWEAKGAVVKDDAKKYLFWAAPKTQYRRDGTKYQFSDVQYRYDIADVAFPEDDLTENERLDMVQ